MKAEPASDMAVFCFWGDINKSGDVSDEQGLQKPQNKCSAVFYLRCSSFASVYQHPLDLRACTSETKPFGYLTFYFGYL